MNPLMIPVYAVLAIYLTWTLYLAIMVLARARNDGKLPVWALRLAYPLLMFGYAMDFLLNVLVVSVILLEVPQEWLVTARLSRHIKSDTGWRRAVAMWVCRNLLDWADPKGCHCR